MKIKSLFYRDNYWGWEFETSFQDFNLLVGISGSGKSQILNAILALKNIAKGASMNGIEWKLHFESEEGKEYIWEGEFKKVTVYDEREIHREIFYSVDGVNKVERTTDGSVIVGEKVLTMYKKDIILNHLLDISKSILALLKNADWISDVLNGFDNIIFRDHTKSQQDRELDFYRFYHLKEKYDEINGIEDLRKLKTSIAEKLIIAQEKKMPILEEIKNSFISIFPQVANWVVQVNHDEDVIRTTRHKGYIAYSIKVEDNSKWIPHYAISSGMLRTLNHLIEINLCSDHTIFLIDEYENSLGTNCINVLAEDLLAESMRLQFIITSHHPYIINNIPMVNWLVLSRHAGKISVHKAAELGLGISKHEHYLQLINSPIYNNIQ